MPFVVLMCVLVIVGAAALSALALRRVERELIALQRAIDDLAHVPLELVALRAETTAAGMALRLGPNP